LCANIAIISLVPIISLTCPWIYDCFEFFLCWWLFCYLNFILYFSIWYDYNCWPISCVCYDWHVWRTLRTWLWYLSHHYHPGIKSFKTAFWRKYTKSNRLLHLPFSLSCELAWSSNNWLSILFIKWSSIFCYYLLIIMMCFSKVAYSFLFYKFLNELLYTV
jgi:hypothetical protein